MWCCDSVADVVPAHYTGTTMVPDSDIGKSSQHFCKSENSPSPIWTPVQKTFEQFSDSPWDRFVSVFVVNLKLKKHACSTKYNSALMDCRRLAGY